MVVRKYIRHNGIMQQFWTDQIDLRSKTKRLRVMCSGLVDYIGCWHWVRGWLDQCFHTCSIARHQTATTAVVTTACFNVVVVSSVVRVRVVVLVVVIVVTTAGFVSWFPVVSATTAAAGAAIVLRECGGAVW